MPRDGGTSSITTVGAWSLRAVIMRSSGVAASRPSASRQEIETRESSSTTRGGVRIVAACGGISTPSTVAAASGRLAVTTTDTMLPFTGASEPPRMSCRRQPGRWR